MPICFNLKAEIDVISDKLNFLSPEVTTVSHGFKFVRKALWPVWLEC